MVAFFLEFFSFQVCQSVDIVDIVKAVPAAVDHESSGEQRFQLPDILLIHSAEAAGDAPLPGIFQNGFNGGIWAKLEAAVRECIPQDDTLYIVTGATFTKFGEEEKIDTILNKNDGKQLPVPNYYWKAVLKVKREQNQPVAGLTIGFWLPHDDLKGFTYDAYTVSVDQIEEWTGFDLFVNLPDGVETQAESNADWADFINY